MRYIQYISFILHRKALADVASWLVRSSPNPAVRVRTQAGDIALCFWARHVTLTVLLTTRAFKWVLANLMLGGNPKTLIPGPRTPTTDRVRGLPMDLSTDFPHGPPLRTTTPPPHQKIE